VFLLLPAHPGSSGHRAVKWLLLLLKSGKFGFSKEIGFEFEIVGPYRFWATVIQVTVRSMLRDRCHVSL